jgi:hypothetical protein
LAGLVTPPVEGEFVAFASASAACAAATQLGDVLSGRKMGVTLIRAAPFGPSAFGVGPETAGPAVVSKPSETGGAFWADALTDSDNNSAIAITDNFDFFMIFSGFLLRLSVAHIHFQRRTRPNNGGIPFFDTL